MNYKDKAAAARHFIGRYGNPFTAIGSDAEGRGAIDWGVYGMPETFVVDGKGKVVYKHVGPISPDSIATNCCPRSRRLEASRSRRNAGPVVS